MINKKNISHCNNMNPQKEREEKISNLQKEMASVNAIIKLTVVRAHKCHGDLLGEMTDILSSLELRKLHLKRALKLHCRHD